MALIPLLAGVWSGITYQKVAWVAASVASVWIFSKMASSREPNILEKIRSSPELIQEEPVPPHIQWELEHNLKPEKTKSPEPNTMEFKLEKEVAKILDVDNPKYGWPTLMHVYKKTLNGITQDQLIEACRKILKADATNISRFEYVTSRDMVQRFCTFPRKVKNKLTHKDIHKYKHARWQTPTKRMDIGAVARPEFKNSKGEFDIIKYCSWFPNYYTIPVRITLDEVEFMISCNFN